MSRIGYDNLVHINNSISIPIHFHSHYISKINNNQLPSALRQQHLSRERKQKYPQIQYSLFQSDSIEFLAKGNIFTNQFAVVVHIELQDSQQETEDAIHILG